jgi:hypothetical protein
MFCELVFQVRSFTLYSVFRLREYAENLCVHHHWRCYRAIIRCLFGCIPSTRLHVPINDISINNNVERIYLILGFQYIVSIIIVWSMLKVAYIYDNQSWEYVHSLTNAGNAIGTQLDTDKLTKKELDKKHTEMLNEKIGKLKDN